MGIEDICNLYSLLTAVVALLICLFRYVEAPRGGWMHATMFFLANLLSSYYWTLYSLIMGSDPDVSALFAYFGWNLSYVFLLILIRKVQFKDEKKYIHPLMFLPVPINVAQFILYLQFGGLFNNIWQNIFCTTLACVSMQSILYWWRHRKEGMKFPFLHLFSLTYVASEYAMWTISCFDWPENLPDPYIIVSFISYTLYVVFPFATQITYINRDPDYRKTIAYGYRTRVLLQIVFSALIIAFLGGGYGLAVWIKNQLFLGTGGDVDEGIFKIVAMSLFVISVVMMLIIISVMGIVSSRQNIKVAQEQTEKKVLEMDALAKNLVEHDASAAREMEEDAKRAILGRFNFAITLIVTFFLMVFVVVFTSNLFYRISVNNAYDNGQDKADSMASIFDNYLNAAESVLWVTADTVDTMIQTGSTNEDIHRYMLMETEFQTKQLDENYIGLYGYIRGEYIDGLDWVPPEGYDPKARDWYIKAIEANGAVTIVPPYIDMQTKDTVITICKMMADGESVMAYDIRMRHIQDMTESVDFNGDGFAFVMDRDGLIIAHHDQDKNGLSTNDVFGDPDLTQEIAEAGEGSFDAVMDGKQYTVFVSNIKSQWFTIVAVERHTLLSDMRKQIVVNIVVYALVFFLMAFFYYSGYKNEQKNRMRVEEMKINRQKQEYETKMLKVEMSASDAANRAKSAFLADMSHEIRTPINAVLGMNEMILRESVNEEILGYAKNIQTSGKALLSLINSILDFSKIEDGKMEIIPTNYATTDMVQYLVHSILERANNKGLEFKLEVDEKIPKILYGDDVRLSQVILNLLTNAVKYTKEGSVTLRCTVAEQKEDTVRIRVEVADTGIGIKEEDLPKLFESFQRIEEERNRNIEGTGLGMSIVTRLLHMMNSELDVKSVYGEGSVFAFEIRQGVVDATPIGNYSLKDVDGNGDQGFVRTYREIFKAPKARILIVDDTEMNIQVAKQLLKKTEIEIDTARSGEESIAMAKNIPYDVILMDQRMPRMDGTEALKRIRATADGKNKGTPVICLTADAISGAKERYLSEGFADYLSKPIEGRALEKMLIRHLPADKVHIEKEDKNDRVQDTTDRFEVLTKGGIHTDQGMEYAGKDASIYESILEEYKVEFNEKRDNLNRYYEAKDWNNYGIQVHALKSTSKTIGAPELSELAAALEAAAKEEDEAKILAEHETMMKRYVEIVDLVRKFLQDTGEGSGDSSRASEAVSGEDDVLEFLPEGD